MKPQWEEEKWTVIISHSVYKDSMQQTLRKLSLILKVINECRLSTVYQEVMLRSCKSKSYSELN